MNRTELTIAIASALFVAAVLGWVLRWAFDRLNTTAPLAEDEVVSQMKASEAARKLAEADLAEFKIRYHQLEAQMKAEVDAAMDGLGDARREASDLRQRLDDVLAERG